MKARILIFVLMTCLGLQAQEKQRAYIEEYREVAVREMREFGIPASIIMAQAILESASGTSYLAAEGNNHFGIKCHLDWKGKKLYKDDDEKDECFRAYPNAAASYRDHSLFLKNRSRYAVLFSLPPTDYRAWARGLRKAGYATNRNYDRDLIDLINRYQLYDLDEDMDSSRQLVVRLTPNKVKYVVAREGDSFESLAEATDKRLKELLRYNELAWDSRLEAGQIVYLQPKRKKASHDYPDYTVKEGDTMYGIAQRFAIRLEELYERNGMRVGEQPRVGRKLLLR